MIAHLDVPFGQRILVSPRDVLLDVVDLYAVHLGHQDFVRLVVGEVRLAGEAARLHHHVALVSVYVRRLAGVLLVGVQPQGGPRGAGELHHQLAGVGDRDAPHGHQLEQQRRRTTRNREERQQQLKDLMFVISKF